MKVFLFPKYLCLFVHELLSDHAHINIIARPRATFATHIILPTCFSYRFPLKYKSKYFDLFIEKFLLKYHKHFVSCVYLPYYILFLTIIIFGRIK